MKKYVRIIIFCLSSLTLISWDRATKELAKEHLMNKGPVSYFHDTFRFEYAENTGAALNLGDNLPHAANKILLGILPLVILLSLFIYTIKRSGKLSLTKMSAFALIISGGLGNVIDRLVFDRRVTDFMNIGINDLRTGIFNFADICVTTGVILLAVSFYDKRKQSA